MAKIKSLTDIPSIASYFNRIGAEARSLKTAVVKEVSGPYWRDKAIIRINRDGSVECPDEYTPTEDEALRIKAEVSQHEWPAVKLLRTIENPPKEIREADPENVFEFRDERGMLRMIQVRIEGEDGSKIYVPWTFWDDGEWRRCEPDGLLPLWGIDKIGQNTTVFIHEGAKAARAVHRMVTKETLKHAEAFKNHPWGRELASGAHVGWIGGALSPQRTDWAVLKRLGIKRAYIISDNDGPGVKAVPLIAQQLRMVTFHVQFTNEWPVSFDLADEWPEHFFSNIEGKKHYIGPDFRSCVHPATWMTDVVANPRGRPTVVLRDHAVDLWAYVEEADLFVCTEMPQIIRSESVLNRMLAGFSHSNETSKLIVKAYSGRTPKLCYRPDRPERIITESNTAAINLHVPSYIRPLAGDASKWIEFMQYMFPNKNECKEVMRWCATLIARPEIRMSYSLLLVSEKQGVGKNTLGSNILAPLVGLHNTSWPSESDIIDSNFNGWAAHKRLVIVSEIYSGHSWKAYNKLKSIITDSELEINQKFLRPYRIENWCHVIACSNSLRALKVEEDDRRWFYPEVTDQPWPLKKFDELRKWLAAGGLSIIKQWAIDYGDYVLPGERAPMTERKKELISGSRSEAQREAVEIAHALIDRQEPVALAMKSIVAAVRASSQGIVYDSDYELRKAMIDVGAIASRKRIKIHGRMQQVIYNRAMAELLSSLPEELHAEEIRKHLKEPSSIMEGSM